jgi:hypothetical protein
MTTPIVGLNINHTAPSITKEELMRRVPSVFTKEKSNKLSNRYTFVDSEAIVDTFLNNGFGISQANGVKARSEDGRMHAKHVLKFRPLDGKFVIPDTREIGMPLFTEIVMRNSSDGTSPVIFNIGLFSLVCLNGAVVGKEYASFKARHVNINIDMLMAYISKFPEFALNINNTVHAWSKRTLTQDERFNFARQASVIRWGNEKANEFEAKELLLPRRASDNKSDLWSTFNVIQENIIKGGVISRNQNKDNSFRTSRGITSAIKDVSVNQDLWNLAETFA